MDNNTLDKVREWVKDFEKTQPKNVQVDDDTFEGGAYNLFKSILSHYEVCEQCKTRKPVEREILCKHCLGIE